MRPVIMLHDAPPLVVRQMADELLANMVFELSGEILISSSVALKLLIGDHDAPWLVDLNTFW